MLNLIHFLSISWDLLTVAVSPALSMSGSILSFRKCAMTLKKPFFTLGLKAKTRAWQGLQALLLVFDMFVHGTCYCSATVKRGWLNGHAFKPPPTGSVMQRTWRRQGWRVDRWWESGSVSLHVWAQLGSKCRNYAPIQLVLSNIGQ